MKKVTPQTHLTLAVFPFENLTPGGVADLFCTSFSIDLITELSRFRQFQIISYESVRDLIHVRIGQEDLPDELHTGYFVRGSFRTHKNSIRLNVQLIESNTQRLIWAERFKNDMDHLMDLQEELLFKVVVTLQEQLNYDLIYQIRKKQKTSLKTYECWLYGMEELRKGSLENDLKAREFFLNAIDLDPSYSLAYTGMSLTYFNEWSCQLWERWELSQNGAFKWAQKAIELDEQNYVAAYVLGRIFLYQGAYETAEHYLRKSLRLNGNDPESLINISLCFNYLGYQKEAYKLYEKAVRLNPAASEIYYPIGAIILFELGKTEEAIALANRSFNVPYVDFHAIYAAAWYELGDLEKMNAHLDKFLKSFSEVVKNSEKVTLDEAVEWLSNLNPYKEHTRYEKFWTYLTGGTFQLKKPDYHYSTSKQENVISENTDFWEFNFNSKKVQLAALKGFTDLKKLIQQSGNLIHCTELMDIPVLSGGEIVIDEQAKTEYRSKISSLQKEIEIAENHHDFEKAENLQIEYEKLLNHLTSSLGLNGIPRKAGDTVDKARSAVTWRIRSAISKIEQAHPPLGKHLSNSIKTGIFCSYEPEKPMDWMVN